MMELIVKMLMNVGYSIIIKKKDEFRGLLSIQDIHHQMTVTRMQSAKILSAVINAYVVKAILEVVNIVRTEMSVNCDSTNAAVSQPAGIPKEVFNVNATLVILQLTTAYAPILTNVPTMITSVTFSVIAETLTAVTLVIVSSGMKVMVVSVLTSTNVGVIVMIYQSVMLNTVFVPIMSEAMNVIA